MRHKLDELKSFALDHKPDVILTQENKISNNISTCISGYVVHRDDQNSTPVVVHGTAVFIKSTIPHHRIPTPPLTIIEATLIKITPKNTPPTIIASIYIPNHSTTTLTNDLDTIFNLADDVVICGDLNAKHSFWNKFSKGNQIGNIIFNYTKTNFLNILAPDKPTRFGRSTSSVLDFAIIKNFHFLGTAVSIPELSSDHNPVSFTFNIKIDNTPKEVFKTNWESYKERLTNVPSSPPTINNTNDIETAVAWITDNILQAHKNSSIKVTVNNGTFVPHELRLKIRHKNRLRKEWQKRRSPFVKNELNRLQREIRDEFHELRQQSWTDYISALCTEDNSIWKAAKKCTSEKTKFASLNSNNGLVHSNEEKVEVLADAYESQFDTNKDIPPPSPSLSRQIYATVNNFINTPTNSKPPLPTMNELIAYIKKIKIKKAPGRDGVTNKMIKNLTNNFMDYLLLIVTNILIFNYFPSLLKTAVIIPIHKPGKDPHDPISYRPISLMPIFGKIAEVFIKNRLTNFLEENNTLINDQFGFRKSHSTNHQLLRVTEYIYTGLPFGHNTGAVFLDIAKAFDKVCHVSLIFKLIQIGLPDYLIKTIYSYLSNRNFTVKIFNTYSSPRPVKASCPQGSLLGPILFNCYINDIPQTPKTKICLFADDTAILARARTPKLIGKHLQHHISLIEKWLINWKIKINVDKTAAVLFHKKKRNSTPPKITMYNTPIVWSNSAKYLGIFLDNKLNWNAHIDYSLSKFRKIKMALIRLIGKYTPLSPYNKVLLYKMIIRPTFTYGCQIWGGAPKPKIKKLCVQQNKLLRMIYQAPWFYRNKNIQNELNVPPLENFMARIAKKFFENVEAHSNPEISNIKDYNILNPVHKNRPKNVLKYLAT